MTDKIFLDTNLWIYLYAKTPVEKHEPVYQIVITQFENIVTSTQVLGELYSVLTRKNLVSTAADAKAIVLEMATDIPVFEVDTPKVVQALDICDRYQYSYWDSLIVATALLAKCHTLYSEDLHHSQLINGELKIVNPF